ncbi:MAG: tRNA (adenosine(37)-N6)-threonylcarbamoyltransferase complex transferase subunit TsaD [bacterium]|nr:tRNA (adenosine(37)-N6)-threonylcarbamoyltransferase complex transferase subunit TsaD [bacterium]
MLVLGIETSCDETSVALVREGREILSNIILSQLEHVKFGGVVPEVASREHLRAIIPVYDEAFKQAGVDLEEVDLVAATMGPGLVGPLLVGLTFAKGLAYSRSIPFVAVNHMEGHLAANILEHPELEENHLTLIVSGGHTMLVEVKKFGEYELLGQTKDDAAGEAFDKVAKIMGLGYPGGVQIDRLAREGDPKFLKLPRPMIRDDSFQFSYSGLKTAVMMQIKKMTAGEFEQHRADIAASFQEAAVDVLVEKTIRAARMKKTRDLTISGGVAANSRLREVMQRKCDQANRRLFYPSLPLCTDNAAMIAAAGYYQFKNDGPSELTANAIPYLKLV